MAGIQVEPRTRDRRVTEDLIAGPITAAQLTAAVVHSVRVDLVLPYERPPKALVGNSRAHWRQRSADTQQVRTDVMSLARQAGLHFARGISHITVELVWAPGDRRRRDADNLWPLLKACCDALARGPRRDWVGLELVPDDTPEHMTKLAPRIQPPPAKGMWLVLTLDFATEETA
jgi:crossover junction endodeoxyribonuclease RusA